MSRFAAVLLVFLNVSEVGGLRLGDDESITPKKSEGAKPTEQARKAGEKDAEGWWGRGYGGYGGYAGYGRYGRGYGGWGGYGPGGPRTTVVHHYYSAMENNAKPAKAPEDPEKANHKGKSALTEEKPTGTRPTAEEENPAGTKPTEQSRNGVEKDAEGYPRWGYGPRGIGPPIHHTTVVRPRARGMTTIIHHSLLETQSNDATSGDESAPSKLAKSPEDGEKVAHEDAPALHGRDAGRDE